MIAIRAATPEDASTMSKLRSDSIRRFGPSSYSPEVVAEWAREVPASRYVEAMALNEKILIAVDNDILVGFGSIILQQSELRAIYVHSSYARQGIGSMLLLELEKSALVAGVDALKSAASLNAVPFYESCGYLKGEIFNYRLKQGDIETNCECIWMTKLLERK